MLDFMQCYIQALTIDLLYFADETSYINYRHAILVVCQISMNFLNIESPFNKMTVVSACSTIANQNILK
jgi:hypothetical protein